MTRLNKTAEYALAKDNLSAATPMCDNHLTRHMIILRNRRVINAFAAYASAGNKPPSNEHNNHSRLVNCTPKVKRHCTTRDRSNKNRLMNTNTKESDIQIIRQMNMFMNRHSKVKMSNRQTNNYTHRHRGFLL